MKKIVLLIAAFMLLTQAAQAGMFSHQSTHSETSSKADQSAEVAQETLQNSSPADAAIFGPLVDRMKQEFGTLEQLRTQGRFAEALTQSKAMLDEVRIKTGIDPKSNKREIIVSGEDVFGDEYTVIGKNLNQFTLITQNKIMDMVQKNKGGFYLDLLNLLKRTNLVYIEAFLATLKQKPEGLLDDDRAKIREDLLNVIVVPIYLIDKVHPKTPLLIFDADVANDDQNYLFNRELKIYMIRNGADLGFTGKGPQAIAGQLDQLISAKRTRVMQGFAQAESSQAVTQAKPQQKYTDDQDPYQNRNYQACFALYKKDYVESRASETCLLLYKKYNYFNPVFKECVEVQSNDYTMSRSVGNCYQYAK